MFGLGTAATAALVVVGLVVMAIVYVVMIRKEMKPKPEKAPERKE
jgi:hypothetical protein